MQKELQKIDWLLFCCTFENYAHSSHMTLCLIPIGLAQSHDTRPCE